MLSTFFFAGSGAAGTTGSEGSGIWTALGTGVGFAQEVKNSSPDNKPTERAFIMTIFEHLPGASGNLEKFPRGRRWLFQRP